MAHMKPFALRLELRDPEDAQQFLEGCILASQNNNSPMFRELIDGLNQGMKAYRLERAQEYDEVQA